MPACALHRKLKIGIALFHHVNERDASARRAENCAVLQLSAALVQHKLQAHTPALQLLRYAESTQIQRFLIIAEGEIGRSAKSPSASQQILRRLQNPEYHLLDVQRAPAPDISVFDCAGECVIGPVLFRSGHHRHHILVRHVKAGEQALIRAGDGDQHRVADAFKAPGFHHRGEAFFHQLLQGVKFPKVRQAVVGKIYRSALNCPGEVLCCSLCAEICIPVLSGKKRCYRSHASLSSR